MCNLIGYQLLHINGQQYDNFVILKIFQSFTLELFSPPPALQYRCKNAIVYLEIPLSK